MFMFFLWDNSGDDLLEGGLISAVLVKEEANICIFVCIDLLWKTTYATQRIH